MTSIKSVQELFETELFDIYNAEKQLTKALPKMAKKASNEELAQAFTDHLEETEGQIERLEQVFELLGIKKKGEKCEAMAGLIEEAEELIGEIKDDAVLDAALITAAQKVEHYEIATYGSLCELANELGHRQAASLLHQTLEEEKSADSLLNNLAKGKINSQAMRTAA